MNLKTFLKHRLRDLSSVFQSNSHSLNLLFYSLIRPFYKIYRFDESKISAFIPGSIISLFSFKFKARAGTLDYCLLSNFYEPGLTKELLTRSGDVFLDIGAHIGRFSILASRTFKRVFAFEANLENFNALKENISLNNLKNVTPLHIAVSDKEGHLFVTGTHANTGEPTVSKLKPSILPSSSVPSLPLDVFLKNNQITPSEVDFIKIDVERHEKEVLTGAKNLLKKGSPLLCLEILSNSSAHSLLLKNQYALLKKLDEDNYLYHKSFS